MVTKNKEGVIRAYFNEESNVKTSNNSFSTGGRGRVLYSYNTPIAYKDDSGRQYLNKDKYSSTTSSQQTLFRRGAENRNVKYEEVSEKELNKKIGGLM